MPIYAYRCSACGHDHDALQKMSDAPLLECPVCHALALQKQVTAAGFQLKGSGWYVTDFKNKDAAPKKDKTPTDDKTPAAAGAEAAAPAAGPAPAAAPAPTPAPAPVAAAGGATSGSQSP